MKKRLRAQGEKEDSDCQSSDNGVEASGVGVPKQMTWPC